MRELTEAEIEECARAGLHACRIGAQLIRAAGRDVWTETVTEARRAVAGESPAIQWHPKQWARFEVAVLARASEIRATPRRNEGDK